MTGWTIDNSGSATVASGTILNGPGTFNNMSNGQLTLEANTTFLNAGPGTLNNAGTMVVSAGTGTATIDATTFNNTGSVTVVSGALAILSSGTSSGSFDVAAGALFQFSGDITTNAPYVLAPGAVLSGAGQYQVDARIHVPRNRHRRLGRELEPLRGGTIQGTGSLTVTNAFDWPGGNFSGSGTLSIPSGGNTFDRQRHHRRLDRLDDQQLRQRHRRLGHDLERLRARSTTCQTACSRWKQTPRS